MPRTNRFGSLCLALALSASVAGCGGGAGGDEEGGTELLRVAVSAFAYESFEPKSGSQANHAYWEPVYDFMFYEEQGEITPGLIDEWELSDDSKTWKFHVREGVEWHNGRALDAEDIKFNFDYWITAEDSNHSTSARIGQIIDEVTVVDDMTVQIELKEPMPLLLEWLSWTSSSPVVPREYGEMSADEIEEAPVGTGPWKLVERRVGELVRFEALDDHWRETPEYDALEIAAVPEDSTRLARLRQGEADIIEAPLSMIPEVEGTGLELVTAEEAQTVSVVLAGVYEPGTPHYKEGIPWEDRDVREALNIAIDKQAIIDSIFQGRGKLATQMSLLPWQIGYDEAWEPLAHDPDRARELLAKAGYPNGFSIKLHSYARPGVPNLPTMLEAVAGDWEKVGVSVEIVNSDWNGVVRPIVRERDADFALGMALGVFPPDTDPLWWQEPNYFYEASPLINEAISSLHGADNREAAVDAIRAIGDAVQEEVAFVPVAILDQVFVVDPDRVGEWPVVPHAGGVNRLEYLRSPGS